MFTFDGGVLVPIFAMAIPVVAIVGGITAGIVRMVLKARIVELAQRERIAAIERGIDPSQLAPLSAALDGDDRSAIFLSPRQAVLARARGLMVGGIITLSVGVGLGVMLGVLAHDSDPNVWAVGAIPAFIGLALLLSSVLVRRGADEAGDRPAPPAAQG